MPLLGVNSHLSIFLCLNPQRGLLRGLHGEGEEDWEDVCNEVCEEETEDRPQSGKRDQCVKEVSASVTMMSTRVAHSSEILIQNLSSFSPESNTTTLWGWRISTRAGPTTI